MRLTVPLPLGDPAAIEPAMSTPTRLPTSRPKPSREQAEREGSLLLLVEDHPVNRTVLGHQLAIVGFETDIAEDGQEAFEKYLNTRYALVFTDLNMPRMDGYELTQAIRRHEQETGAPRVPIIALSANVMQGEPERCGKVGMDDFIAKPTTIPFLAGKLQRWLPQLEWPHEHVAQAGEPSDGVTAPGDGRAQGAIDTAVLEELTGGDADLAASLLDDFVDASKTDLRALEQAITDRELDAVRRQAHRLKGAARTVGAHQVSQLAQQIEESAADGSADWHRYEALLARLDAALGEVAHTPVG